MLKGLKKADKSVVRGKKRGTAVIETMCSLLYFDHTRLRNRVTIPPSLSLLVFQEHERMAAPFWLASDFCFWCDMRSTGDPAWRNL